MSVSFYFVDPKRLRIPLRKFRYCIEQLVLHEGYKVGNVNVVFCDNRYIYRLNAEFLKHFYPTDVITFDYSEFPILSGDIYVGVEVVKVNAVRYGETFQRELLRVVLHGILHLCGYGDSNVAQIEVMRKKENFYLKLFSDYAG